MTPPNPPRDTGEPSPTYAERMRSLEVFYSGSVQPMVRQSAAMDNAHEADALIARQAAELESLRADVERLETLLAERTQAYLDRGDTIVRMDEEMRALRQRVEELTWQPIATAPKDGSHVLLWRECISFVGYHTDKCGWRINAPGLPAMDPPPTHWQPLPSFPTTPDATNPHPVSANKMVAIRDVAQALKLYPELDWTAAEFDGRFILAPGEVRTQSVDVLVLACKARAEMAKRGVLLFAVEDTGGQMSIRSTSVGDRGPLRSHLYDPTDPLSEAHAVLLAAAEWARGQRDETGGA